MSRGSSADPAEVTTLIRSGMTASAVARIVGTSVSHVCTTWTRATGEPVPTRPSSWCRQCGTPRRAADASAHVRTPVHADAMAVRRQARLDAAVARYWTKVEKTDTCWLWTGGVHKGTGYGQGGLLGETIAHRAAYRLAFGSIPDGLVIDHLCRVKTCVNPAHLEAVPQRENVRRGIAVELRHLRPRAPKTHCLNGHARTVDQISSNGACRVCQREREPSREPRTHKRRVAA